MLAGRRKEPIEAVAEEIAKGGGEAIAVPTDVGEPESVDALFKTVKDRFGRLDVIFNNAGINAPGHAARGSALRPVAARWSPPTSPASSSAPRAPSG